MARVEPVTSEKQADSIEPKARVKGMRFRQPGCFSLILLVIIVMVGWLGWLLASAGVISTPFFETLKPRRQITEEVLSSAELADRIARESLVAGQGELKLSESELSKLLADELVKLSRPPLDSSQLVIDRHDIELYGTLAGRPQLAVSVAFVPAIIDDKLAVDIQHFQFGHLNLPAWLAQAFIGTVLTQSLPRSLEVIQPNTINLSSGSILFTL